MMTNKRPSQSLQKAQEQLLALRQSLGVVPQGSSVFGHAEARLRQTFRERSQTQLTQRRQQEAKRQGVQASDSLKATLAQKPAASSRLLSVKASQQKEPIQKQTSVKAYPSMLTAMLSEGFFAYPPPDVNLSELA